MEKLKIMITLDLSADEASTVLDCMLRGSRPNTIPVADIDSAVKKIEDAQKTSSQVNPTYAELDAAFKCVNTLPRTHQIAARPTYASACLKLSNERSEAMLREEN
jgi:hypothetical protein